MQYDNGQNAENRMLIFYSQANLERLANAQTFFMDGIFSVNHKDCFYHLTQASWRQMQQLGLVPLYNNDDDFRLSCGMMEGFAVLPVSDLTNGIHLLRTICPDDPPEADELLDYFDSTSISGRLRQQNPAQNLRSPYGLNT
jgi:hypothetical protein